MKRKKKKLQTNNLKTAFIFIILVFSLIALSLLFKLGVIISDSKFDAKHNFAIVIYSKDNLKNRSIISFAPDNQSISILKVDTDVKPPTLGRILEVPIDGEIRLNQKLSELEEGKEVELILGKILFKYQDIKTRLTIIDIARLWFFSKSVPASSISIKKLNLLSFEQKFTDEAIDRISAQIFFDNVLSGEKISIQIINGTEVLGLGNRLGRLISNIGGNVVAVSTSDKALDKSEILSLNRGTYTYQRLSKILGFRALKLNEPAISDIVIKIGKDTLSSLVF